jgi:hypothetical protein
MVLEVLVLVAVAALVIEVGVARDGEVSVVPIGVV